MPLTGVQAATEQRWDDAERMFRVVLNEEPDSASAWSNLGNVHLSKGRAQDAFEDFSRAIKLAPTVSQHSPYSSMPSSLHDVNESVTCVSLQSICTTLGQKCRRHMFDLFDSCGKQHGQHLTMPRFMTAVSCS